MKKKALLIQALKACKTIKMMKVTLTFLFFILITCSLRAQTSGQLERKNINTQIGQIAVFQKQTEFDKTPIIFLHGVFFDHLLWEYQIDSISDRPVFIIDMPMHGESKVNIKDDWNLDNCAEMLLEILDSLKIDKVIAIGHSWGSMTILRAANKKPDRFLALGLCNMPFKELTKKEVRSIKFQHSALVFRKFFIRQASKSMMSKESITKNPALVDKLITSMSKVTNKEIKYTNKTVRIESKDASDLIKTLTMPVVAMVGDEDIVGLPLGNETIVVKGGHVSPIEVPEEVNKMIIKFTKLDEGKNKSNP